MHSLHVRKVVAGRINELDPLCLRLERSYDAQTVRLVNAEQSERVTLSSFGNGRKRVLVALDVGINVHTNSLPSAGPTRPS